MPRHETSTSFKPGHKRSQESIEKQKRTIRTLVDQGTWSAQQEEVRAKNRGPHPKRAIKIHKRICEICSNEYLPISGRQRWCQTCIPHKIARNRMRRYGLTDLQFGALISFQHGLCAVCGEKEPTDIDHDHQTGAIRGLVCTKCNIGLGHMDNPEWLAKALAYLKITP